MDRARAFLNDPNGVIWANAVLFPFLESAYRSLQEDLAINGVSLMQATTDIDVPLVTLFGTTLAPNPARIADDTNPQLPADCVVPFTLQERHTGTDDLFVPMEKITGPLPGLQPVSYLRLWKWESDQVELVGATQEITIRMTYERALPALASEADPVLIPHCSSTLAYTVAALAARSRGARQLAIDMEQAASLSQGKLIQRYTRPEQYKVRRKQPYGRHRRIVYL